MSEKKCRRCEKIVNPRFGWTETPDFCKDCLQFLWKQEAKKAEKERNSKKNEV